MPKVDRPAAAPIITGKPPETISEEAWEEQLLKEAANIVMIPEPPDTGLVSVSHDEGRTELANAKRLIQQHGAYLRYVVEWSSWLVWDGCRWRRDLGNVSMQSKATGVVEQLWDCVKNLSKKSEWLRKDLIRFATNSNTVKGVTNLITMARPYVSMNVRSLDTNSDLFNCANGTIDLVSGRRLDANPSDYITKLCPYPYDPSARCPRWSQFLEEVFQGDGNKIGYLQRLLGYSLTGSVAEQILPVMWGGGSNGKSTLFNLLGTLLGPDYYGSPPRELFKMSSSDRHPTEVMTLQGKRLTVAHELEAGTRLNESLIKYLTGGDLIAGRGVYENFITFAPTHKLFLLTNHKPKVSGTDLAIWRRLKVLEMTAEFREEDGTKDPHLGVKLLDEAPGILAWMVRGCLDWREGGLREPECVRLATDTYRRGEDEIGRFLEENCTRGELYSVSAGELMDAFKAWAPDGSASHLMLSQRLTEMGLAQGKLTHGPFKNRKVWRGLCLSASIQERFPGFTGKN
jgi:putative DNA primase/helicase